MLLTMRNIAIAVIFVSLGFASQQEPPKTNREIFYRLCDSAMDTMATDALNYRSAIFLKASNDMYSSVLRLQFIQGLSERRVLLFLQPDSTTMTLELSVRESSVLYGEVFSESFLGERKSERTIVLTLFAVFVSHVDGKVIETKQISMINKDTVAFSSINELNDNSFPFSRYKVPEVSFFDSIVEPAIVTIASGVAIYLFFTIRS